MTGLLLYKIGITMMAVLGLSFVAEKISTRLAGLLSGYPIGTAIILHFYGLEYGAQFAADAAIFNLCGLFASQCFAYVLRSEPRHFFWSQYSLCQDTCYRPSLSARRIRPGSML
jgi:hypothetical protein